MPQFSAFTSHCDTAFSTVRFTVTEEKAARETPLSLEEKDYLLSTFDFPLEHIEIPSWSSHILNIPRVRRLLEDCSGYGERVTLEIRDKSLVVTDYLHHCMDIFYSEESNTFRIENPLLYPFLHDMNAIMIHSSCVDFGGKAAVFLAMDEGGKTTAASLCVGGKVLSDDQIIFRKQEDDSWLAYGTPWTTFPPDPGHAAPAAFFLLEKADEFSLTKLGSLELFAHLWNEHRIAKLLIPKIYHTKIMDLYRELSSSAPVYLMKFPKDYIDQDAILKCMKP